MPSNRYRVRSLLEEVEQLQIRVQYLEAHQALTPEEKTLDQLQTENQALKRYLSDTAVQLIRRHYRRHGSPAPALASSPKDLGSSAACCSDLAPEPLLSKE